MEQKKAESGGTKVVWRIFDRAKNLIVLFLNTPLNTDGAKANLS